MMGWIFSRYTPWFARYRGFKDARDNYPRPQVAEPQGYIAEVQRAANATLLALAKKYHRRDEKLRKEVHAADLHLLDAGRELHQAEEEHGSETWRKSLSHFWHWTLIIILFVLELPLNAKALEFFHLGKIETLLATGAVAAVIVLLAWGGGSRLRMERRQAMDNIIMACCLVSGTAVVVWMAYLRQQVLSLAVKQAAREMAELMGTARAPVTADGGDPGVLAAFVVMQLALFLVCVLVSYLHHNPLRDARDVYQKAQRRLNHARVSREKTFAHAQARARGLVETAQHLHSSYEGENIRHRQDGLARLPRINPEIPPALLQMETDAVADESTPRPLLRSENGRVMGARS